MVTGAARGCAGINGAVSPGGGVRARAATGRKNPLSIGDKLDCASEEVAATARATEQIGHRKARIMTSFVEGQLFRA